MSKATRQPLLRGFAKSLFPRQSKKELAMPEPIDHDDPADPNQTIPCPWCRKLPEEYVVGARISCNESGTKMVRCKTQGCAVQRIPIVRKRWQTRAENIGTKGPDDAE